MTTSFDHIRDGLESSMVGASPEVAVDALCSACVGLLDVDGAAVSVVHQGSSRGTFGSSSALGRQLDEYQFTYGEGPCLDAVARRRVVVAPDLDSPGEQRWPAFTGAVLGHGVRGVFAVPIMIASSCVGALDLFRVSAGPLRGPHLAGAVLAADLASTALVDLVRATDSDGDRLADQGEDGARDDEVDLQMRMDRIEVYQATGILISQLALSAEDALLRLRAHALATDLTASQVAWAIIHGRIVLDDDAAGPADGDERTQR